jgi:hypothetical protein
MRCCRVALREEQVIFNSCTYIQGAKYTLSLHQPPYHSQPQQRVNDRLNTSGPEGPSLCSKTTTSHQYAFDSFFPQISSQLSTSLYRLLTTSSSVLPTRLAPSLDFHYCCHDNAVLREYLIATSTAGTLFDSLRALSSHHRLRHP